jgi:hypothetical protein
MKSHGQTAESRLLLGCQLENFGGLPECALAPKANDLTNHRGTLSAVAFIDGLNHFFTPFVFEVDVDVWRLFAFRRHEALEEQ